MAIRFFHISKKARIKYKFNDNFYALNGNLIIANSLQARLISYRINEVRKKDGDLDRLTTPGEVNALALLHEIYHYLIRHYSENDNPGVFTRSLEVLAKRLNEKNLKETLLKFIEEFPPYLVYQQKITAEEYLNGRTGTKSNKELLLEELIILYFENSNPAAAKLNELFSDKKLRESSDYNSLIYITEEFFDKEKVTGFGGLHLFSMLQKPISSNPYSLEEQLNFIRNKWGISIDEKLLRKLIQGTDLIKEDYKLFIRHGGGEKATPPVPEYKLDWGKKGLPGSEYYDGDDVTATIRGERFTEDTHWMPEVVMIAKNVYVWMHQLSERYKRNISRLNEIPDEELDRLAEWNFTALWLIGIWERSIASKTIKQLTGNPEAAASAYSLYDYVIANELGGEDAFNNLKYRAQSRGIKIASDMVPNHTGIYSKWVIEKPDYFIRTTIPPYHNYSFNGQNLSQDERVEVRIEDKYYSREDAAVVFERLDRYTGERSYIYHGNDGTNMPWNDTAQLNLLNPEVRESLYQTIKHVAQKTPIIRFDAAMTLTHKHYQRLWYPEPGKGGAIPSRSDFSMTKKEFNNHIPVEFWREVVDRINVELPNTLLLAEAFWLMESYFVRSLGMHRVYNSAFMHMLMKEENDKYRKLICNTLEFNPEILKRYVNFMSNPDEETAINQFGKGDKYFGVAVMLVTLPGLPMFGHGQIEGFSEKYGMEYKRAYYNEPVDEHLVWRHRREIFPLLRMRHLFSQVENFEFYDFIGSNEVLNENVFAFSNSAGNDSALVIYNNSYETNEGRIKYSNPKNQNGRVIPPKDIATIFYFNPGEKFFYIYTDHRTQLQFLLSGSEINREGFKVKMFGYQYRICLNFREVYDESGIYSRLYYHLKGGGVTSIESTLLEMELSPLHSALQEFLAPPNIRIVRNFFFQDLTKKKGEKEIVIIPSSFKDSLHSLIREINNRNGGIKNLEDMEESYIESLNDGHDFYELWIRHNKRKIVPQWMKDANDLLPLKTENQDNEAICVYSIFTTINTVLSNNARDGVDKYDKLLLEKPVIETFENHSAHEESRLFAALIKVLLIFYTEISDIKIKIKKKKRNENKRLNNRKGALQELPLSELLFDENVGNYLQVNDYNNITYFNKERFEILISWLYQLMVIQSFSFYKKALNKTKVKNKTGISTKKQTTKQDLDRELINSIKVSYLSAKKITWLAEEAGYDLIKFSNSLIQVNKKSKNTLKEGIR